MHYGHVVEMQTGEGKTLAATFPLYVAAPQGKGAHLATANDYLAERDAAYVANAFQRLGISVGAITAGSPESERRAAYRCDITYATAKELGFDFLRDRTHRAGGSNVIDAYFGADGDGTTREPIQRSPWFLLVDEADSILLDEARTPLILSGASPSPEATHESLCQWAAAAAPQFTAGDDFDMNARRRTVSLTSAGRQKLAAWPGLQP